MTSDADVSHVELGAGAIPETVEAKLRRLGKSVTDFGATAGAVAAGTFAPPGPDMSAQVDNAFKAIEGQSDDVTAGPMPFRYYDGTTDVNWGLGSIEIPKGRWNFQGWSSGFYNCTGLSIRGAGMYACVLACDRTGGNQLDLVGYPGAIVSDLSLVNAASSGRGTSVALNLNESPAAGGRPRGGGHLLLSNMIINQFATAIRNYGNVTSTGQADPGNGDKTTVLNVAAICDTFYDNTRNNQAIGWSFYNCSSSCAGATFALGGAGQTLIVNNIPDIYGPFIRYPEGSGNPGSNYWPGVTTVFSTKMEQHGSAESGANLILDARASLLGTDAGGSNTDLSLIDVTATATPTVLPEPDDAIVMQVGDQVSGTYKGSNSVRVRAWGGWIRGVIRLCSDNFGSINRRWSFERMIRAPLPEKAQLLGNGFHALLEWRANENVPVDQYRGGQSFIGSIDAERAFLWHSSGAELMRSAGGTPFVGPSGAIPPGQTRYGQTFVVAGFPPKCSFTGLGVFVDGNPGGSSILVEWFADSNFSSLIGSMDVAGDWLGLRRMKESEMIGPLPRGTTLYVRMSKPSQGQIATGPVLAYYFPFMGT